MPITIQFFPRAFERRVLLKVEVCYTSSHVHIFTDSHLLIFIHIFTSSTMIGTTSELPGSQVWQQWSGHLCRWDGHRWRRAGAVPLFARGNSEAGGWLSTWICCVKCVKNNVGHHLRIWWYVFFTCFKYCKGTLGQPLGFYGVPNMWTRLYCEDEDLTRDVSWETTFAVENDLLNALPASFSSKIHCSVWSR